MGREVYTFISISDFPLPAFFCGNGLPGKMIFSPFSLTAQEEGGSDAVTSPNARSASRRDQLADMIYTIYYFSFD
jgi:hypothetical protein